LAMLLLLAAIGAELSHHARLPVWARAELARQANAAATGLACQEHPCCSLSLPEGLAEGEETALAQRDRYTVTRIDGLRLERVATIRTSVIAASAPLSAVSERFVIGAAGTVTGRLIPLRI